MSRVEVLMRDTPVLDRFVDWRLLLGDMVVVFATEASSDMIPLEQMPALTLTLAASWLVAGLLHGDYRGLDWEDADDLAKVTGLPVLVAIVNAMLTWAISTVPLTLLYAFQVSHFLVDPHMVCHYHGEHGLAPQMEIAVALLVVQASWRGIAAKLRM